MRQWLALALGLAVALGAGRARARRFALLVGDDAGDATDEKLHFAQDDAKRMAAVLTELGGVQPGDARVLLEQDAQQVHQALDALLRDLQAKARPGDQLVLYFSGHADEGELHLHGGRLPLSVLNDFAKRAPVDVVLLIIDACRSGSITRLKGLRAVGASPVNVDLSSMKGRVVIGSSGPDEYAQESDSLRGSYFTSHLVAGLRGAADTSRDGVVTLDEAYAYAYAHTIESTFATRGGVQHPSYHMDLRGQGELALTSPSSARGHLRVDLADPAELTVTNTSTGALVGEFIKSAGPAVLAVPPGAYQVRLRVDGRIAEEAVEVPEGGEAVVGAGELFRLASASTSFKGGGGTDLDLGVAAAFGSGLTQGVPGGPGLEVSAAIRPRRLLGPLDTLTLELVTRQSRALGQVPYDERTIDGRAGLAFSADIAGLRARVGPAIGVVFTHQSRLPGSQTRDSFSPEAGISAQAALRLVGQVEVFAQAFGGAAHLSTNVSSRFIWRGDLALGLALRL